MFTFWTYFVNYSNSVHIFCFFYHVPEHPAAENPKKLGRHWLHLRPPTPDLQWHWPLWTSHNELTDPTPSHSHGTQPWLLPRPQNPSWKSWSTLDLWHWSQKSVKLCSSHPRSRENLLGIINYFTSVLFLMFYNSFSLHNLVQSRY